MFFITLFEINRKAGEEDKYKKISCHLNYIIALCYYANEKKKMTTKFFSLALMDGIPFTSFYYIAADLLEENIDSYDKALAYVKLLKRRKFSQPDCFDSKIKLAQFYMKIQDFKNAINV